ncbi:hypothetical protein D3C81_1343220 [compost metagenome]
MLLKEIPETLAKSAVLFPLDSEPLPVPEPELGEVKYTVFVVLSQPTLKPICSLTKRIGTITVSVINLGATGKLTFLPFTVAVL